MSVADLPARLRAAIDETERIARAAMDLTGDTGVWTRRTEPADSAYIDGDSITIYDEGGHDALQADHIARHDPASVLRRCAADRRIVDLHARAHECSQYDHRGDIDNCSWVMEVEYEVCDTVRALADAYGVTEEET